MAHLVSSDRAQLERFGLTRGLHPTRLEFRPMKHPGTGAREAAWHWDLVGPWVPSRRRIQDDPSSTCPSDAGAARDVRNSANAPRVAI